ncbi:MAG: hypothetical protein V3U71_08020 [Cocleimonas sp.]
MNYTKLQSTLIKYLPINDKHMKFLFFPLLFVVLLLLGGCQQQNHESILQKCNTLANESIVYARANYVKLFHYFNPEKFFGPFQQVKDFDHVTHRNVINTYDIAVRKLQSGDPETIALITSCINLSNFSKLLVDQSYPRAIAHKSKHDTLTDLFFIEINNIVKFDHKIGKFDSEEMSFDKYVKNYKKAAKAYIEKFKDDLPATTN